MVKYKPLLCQPTNFVVSGSKVTTTPDENAISSMIKKTGAILGSKTSSQLILNKLQENLLFILFGNVSSNLNKIRMDANAKRDDT